jgi:hypothetical protein
VSGRLEILVFELPKNVYESERVCNKQQAFPFQQVLRSYKRGRLLLLLLDSVEMGLGVGELFDPLDFQIAIFISNVSDDDRFADPSVVCLGELKSRRHVRAAASI